MRETPFQIQRTCKITVYSIRLHRSRSLLLILISAPHTFRKQNTQCHYASGKGTSVIRDWMLKVAVANSIQIVAFQGIYDVWVHKGAVSIYGAVLRASSQLQRVIAPTIHSIPTLKISCDPYGTRPQVAVITIFSCNISVCFLDCVLPSPDQNLSMTKPNLNSGFWNDVVHHPTFRAVRLPNYSLL